MRKQKNYRAEMVALGILILLCAFLLAFLNAKVKVRGKQIYERNMVDSPSIACYIHLEVNLWSENLLAEN